MWKNDTSVKKDGKTYGMKGAGEHGLVYSIDLYEPATGHFYWEFSNINENEIEGVGVIVQTNAGDWEELQEHAKTGGNYGSPEESILDAMISYLGEHGGTEEFYSSREEAFNVLGVEEFVEPGEKFAGYSLELQERMKKRLEATPDEDEDEDEKRKASLIHPSSLRASAIRSGS